MKIKLIVHGRLKEKYFQAAEAEYLKRLKAYCNFEIIETKSEAKLLAALPSNAQIYAFDERGEHFSSREFAAILNDEALHGGGAPVVFLVGGADGHSEQTRKRAKKLLAFGKATIAHRLVRLLIVEQIYRGFRIIRGEPYHRD